MTIGGDNSPPQPPAPVLSGEIVPSAEEYRKAVDTIRRAGRVPPRGDSFDERGSPGQGSGSRTSMVDRVVQDPRGALGLDRMPDTELDNLEGILYAVVNGAAFRKTLPHLGRTGAAFAGTTLALLANNLIFGKRRRLL